MQGFRRVSGAVANRTIGVNLGNFSLIFGRRSQQMPPLRGLGLGGNAFLHRYHPYGIQEVFEVFKVSAEYPVRLIKINLLIR